MALAKLSIDVTAKLGTIEQDLGKVAHVAEKNAQAIQRSFDGATRGVRTFETASASAASTLSGATSIAIRNASYQVSDFIVQVQGGQDAMRALSQQLPQLLAGFGAFGAVAGVVAGIMPTVIQLFKGGEAEAKKLDTALGDLDSAVGEVGNTVREFDMTKLYKQFNASDVAARKAIVGQLEFQRALIETQRLLASQSLRKSTEGIGDFSFGDKLKGAFGQSRSEKIAEQFGVSKGVAADLARDFKELSDDSIDAELFLRKYGETLARSVNPRAQQLVKDVKAVAEGSRDAAAALSRISEAQLKIEKAGDTGKIAIPKKGKPKAPKEAIDVLGEGEFFTRDKQTAKFIRDNFDFERWAWADLARDREKAARAAEQYDEALKRSAASLLKSTDTGRFEAFVEQMEKAQEAFGKGFIDQDQLDAINDKLFDTTEELKKQKELGNSIDKAFSGFFEGAATGAKSLSDAFKQLARDIGNIILKRSVTDKLANAASDFIGGIDWGKLFGFASGGVMTPRGPMPLMSYASGGVADRPQLALFGEGARNEAFVPLPDGRRIPVQMSGAQGVTINQTISVDSRSDRATIVAAMSVAKEQAKREILESMRRGGQFA